MVVTFSLGGALLRWQCFAEDKASFPLANMLWLSEEIRAWCLRYADERAAERAAESKPR